ncbi:hypothetical protein AB0J80_36250 [Actinoplanes sp. NPDC049548]|uniref:hypothetical protein n=1 Tax=Actinoplanes sp. NPDC049548 TaxID=3155152 RepID=UPI00341BAF96
MVTLMQDHPAWWNDAVGAHRVMRYAGRTWHLDAPPHGGLLIEPSAVQQPPLDEIRGIELAGPFQDLSAAVSTIAPVVRVRNGDLWDALGTAIIRQVIRAAQARQMYQRFCRAHGERVDGRHGAGWLFPAPEVVLGLPGAAFAELGMAFKLPALMAAAEAVIRQGREWEQLAPAVLVKALQDVHRIGPWTAGAAVADFTGDFSVYPYSDLAVRTWARRAVPDADWPDDEPEFAALWRHGAGEDLGALTLLTLAWGGTRVTPLQEQPG